MSRVRVTGPAGALSLNDGGRDGLPVVFVHSLAGNSEHWARQLERVRQTQRAVALDLRGHGKSEPPKDGEYTLTSMAADLGAAVDALDLPRFVLVGHSMGAGLALTYAGEHAARVAGLLLVDPIGDGKQIPPREVQTFLQGLQSNYDSMIQGYWSQIAGPDSTVRERLLSDLRATPREAVTRGFRAVLEFDPHPALAAYQGPMLAVVTPQNDQSFSLHRLGKGFPHRMIEGTGHWIQLDTPEEFNRLLDEFLNSVSGKSETRTR
jgi:pimeloyl-ACP methyl ester carboxylesterase